MKTVFNHRLLAGARLELNLTQEEAAAAVGVDVRTYRRYESGEVNEGAEGFSVRHPSRRRILRQIARELGVPEDDLLVDGSAHGQELAEIVAAPAAWMACHGHTLPRARHFVGREKLLDLLGPWWRDSRPDTHVIALVALGGAGKTSLAERFLASIGDGPHAGGVFVFSFYDDNRVEAFFERALAYFAPGRATVGAGERVEALQAALREGAPHLVVLDGLEVLQGSGEAATTYGRVEEGSLRRLLASAARGLGATRFLITSRFQLTDLAAWEGTGSSTVKLDALSEAESFELLGRWGLSGGRAELGPVLERVGRHALSVAMLGSYAGSFLGGDPARLRAVELDRLLGPLGLEPAARDDAQARRLLAVLSTYARALSPEERDVVARLAVFPAGAEISVLEAIARSGGTVAGALAGLDERGFVPILARLERLGLIFASKESRRYGAHPFVAQYFQSILGVDVQAIHALERGRLAARLEGHRSAPTELELLDTHELLLLHTLRSGHVEEAAHIYLTGLGGFAHLGLRLGAMSRGLRILRSFADDGDPARLTGALVPGRKARILYDWGLYAGALGDLPLAIRCYRAHNAVARASLGLDSLTTGLRTLAYTERLTGALEAALALADAAAEVAERAGSAGSVVRAIALRASILHALGRHAEAGLGFARARALGGHPFARRSLWEAEHALDLGRVEEAIAEASRTLATMRDLGWGGHVAHAHTVLGLAVLRRSEQEIDEARVHLEEARRWTSVTGEVEVLLRCLELEARIALAQGDLAQAADATRRGRELADTCGFGLFRIGFDRLA